MGFRNLRFLPVLMLCGVSLAMPGCTRIRTQQGYLVDNLLVDSIKPGIDNRESVEGTLGRPTFIADFGDKDWYYVSRDMRQLAFANPKPVKQTILRVRFDAAGNVTAIDRRGLEKVAHISPEDGKTPTLGRNRTLLQEVFGNIGAVGAAGTGATPGGGGPGPNGS